MVNLCHPLGKHPSDNDKLAILVMMGENTSEQHFNNETGKISCGYDFEVILLMSCSTSLSESKPNCPGSVLYEHNVGET